MIKKQGRKNANFKPTSYQLNPSIQCACLGILDNI